MNGEAGKSQKRTSSPEPSRKKEERGTIGSAFGAALIVLITFAAYLPALRAGFVWDDDSMLTANDAVQAGDGLLKIWFSTHLPDYFPLTSTSLWLEWRLWHLNAAGYHFTNILLHCLSAVILWRVFLRLGVPLAWWAAVLFAVHPINVESVAWIAERKNVLAMFFYALTGYAFLRSENSTGQPISNPAVWYVLSILFFLLALLSKTAVVMLPFVLLLIVWRKERRITRREFVRTIPFFALSLILGLVTVWFQRHRAIAAEALPAGDFATRVVAAAWAFWFYLCKSVLPIHLNFVYPRWQISPQTLISWIPVLAIAMGGMILWIMRRVARTILVCFAYFGLMLLPVLGFVDIYFLRFSPVADHYAYFSVVAICALVCALIWRGSRGNEAEAVRTGNESASTINTRHSFPRHSLVASAAAICVAVLGICLAILTWRRCLVYRDAETLWRAALMGNPGSYLAWNNLGELLLQKGKVDEAISDFQNALKIMPESAESLNNLANGLVQKGQLDQAISLYQKAIQIKPNSPDPYFNLGDALTQKGDSDGAISLFQKTIALQPLHAKARYNIGNLLLQKGQLDDAIAQYQKAVEIDPSYAEPHNNLGNALLQKGLPDEAVGEFQKAIAVNPNNAGARYNLANLLLQKGRVDEAIQHYQQGLELKPNDVAARFNLATVFLLKGRVDEGIAQYQRGLELKPDDLTARNNLGSALLQKGRVDEAIVQFQKVVETEPHSSKAHVNLGLALLQAGRQEEAREQFQEVLRLDAGFALPEAAMRALKER